MKTGDTVKFVCKSGLQCSDVKFRDRRGEWQEADLLNKIGKVVFSDNTRKIQIEFPEVNGAVTMFDHPDDFEILADSSIKIKHDKSGTIIDGHQRYESAVKLGIVPGFPQCAQNCEKIKHLGAGECESICPEKFISKG